MRGSGAQPGAAKVARFFFPIECGEKISTLKRLEKKYRSAVSQYAPLLFLLETGRNPAIEICAQFDARARARICSYLRVQRTGFKIILKNV